MQRTKPTPKQKAFAKAYIKNKFNARKTALEVYDTTEKQAHNLGHQVVNKPIVQKTIQEELAKAGITLDYINESMYKSIEHNLRYGKASQAVASDLIKHAHKLYNAVPSKGQTTIKEERKILVDKDFNVLKEELTKTVSTTNQLLQDL